MKYYSEIKHAFQSQPKTSSKRRGSQTLTSTWQSVPYKRLCSILARPFMGSSSEGVHIPQSDARSLWRCSASCDRALNHPCSGIQAWETNACARWWWWWTSLGDWKSFPSSGRVTHISCSSHHFLASSTELNIPFRPPGSLTHSWLALLDFLSISVLAIELKALLVLDKHSATELHLSPDILNKNKKAGNVTPLLGGLSGMHKFPAPHKLGVTEHTCNQSPALEILWKFRSSRSSSATLRVWLAWAK